MHCMRNVRREALTCSIFGMKRYPMIQVYGWTMKPQRWRYRLIGNVFRKNAIKGEIYTASSKERSKIKEFSLMKGSENIKKVSIAHLMNCLIFQFNKKRTTRYDRQIVFMEIHKGFLWVYVFKKFWVKCFCHKLSGC